MQFTPQELRESIIRPTLRYLGNDSVGVENFLIALAQLHQLKVCAGIPADCALYPVDHDMHHSVWDEHLAFDPDMASRIRGLASQRQFLETPDTELKTNLAYATAIAWAIFIAYPENNGSLQMTRN